MSNRFSKWVSAFDQMMSAATFAEAGDHHTALEINGRKSHRTVLLVIEGEQSHRRDFDYAVGLCKRTQSELEILQVLSNAEQVPKGQTNLISLFEELETDEIPFRATILLGEVRQRLYNYAKRHTDINTVVLDLINKSSDLGHFLTYCANKLSINFVVVNTK